MDPAIALPHFELKYCERCAGLWLRPESTMTPYCPACEAFMAELPLRNLRNQRKPASRSYVPSAVSLLAARAASQQDSIVGWD